MKKYFSVFLLVLFIPSLAAASWWNPFTWFSIKTSPRADSSLQKPAIATSTATASPSAKALPKKTIPSTTSPNVVRQVITPVVPPTVPSVAAPLPNTTLCNGTYYTACSLGQSFVCPPSGGAYCQVPQQYTPPRFVGGPPSIDSVKTLSLTQLSSTSVIMNGWISSYPAAVTFDIADNPGFDRNSGKGSLRFWSNDVSTTITGLFPGGTYYYRISGMPLTGTTFTIGQTLVFTMSTSTPFAQ